MTRYILFSLNTLIFTFFLKTDINDFEKKEFNIEINAPESIDRNSEGIVELTFSVGDVSGFAKLTEDFPDGISVEAIDVGDGTFTFHNGVMKLIWLNFPEKKYFSVKYKVKTKANAPESFLIGGKFNYLKDNKKTSYTLFDKKIITSKTSLPSRSSESIIVKKEDVEIIPNQSTKNNESTNSKQDVEKEQNHIVKIERTIIPISKNLYKIELKTAQKGVKGFFKVQEYTSLGAKMEGLELEGAIFSFIKNKGKFIWMSAPTSDKYTISYKLDLTNAKDKDPSHLKGDFSFLVKNKTIKFEITKSRNIDRKKHGSTRTVIIERNISPLTKNVYKIELNITQQGESTFNDALETSTLEDLIEELNFVKDKGRFLVDSNQKDKTYSTSYELDLNKNKNSPSSLKDDFSFLIKNKTIKFETTKSRNIDRKKHGSTRTVIIERNISPLTKNVYKIGLNITQQGESTFNDALETSTLEDLIEELNFVKDKGRFLVDSNQKDKTYSTSYELDLNKNKNSPFSLKDDFSFLIKNKTIKFETTNPKTPATKNELFSEVTTNNEKQEPVKNEVAQVKKEKNVSTENNAVEDQKKKQSPVAVNTPTPATKNQLFSEVTINNGKQEPVKNEVAQVKKEKNVSTENNAVEDQKKKQSPVAVNTPTPATKNELFSEVTTNNEKQEPVKNEVAQVKKEKNVSTENNAVEDQKKKQSPVAVNTPTPEQKDEKSTKNIIAEAETTPKLKKVAPELITQRNEQTKQSNTTSASSKPSVKPLLKNNLGVKSGVNYRIQIVAGKNLVDKAYFTKRHNWYNDFVIENIDGWIKYTTGSFKVYKDARNNRNQINAGNHKFIGPFVTAYNNGTRITVQEALMISKQKWYQ